MGTFGQIKILFKQLSFANQTQLLNELSVINADLSKIQIQIKEQVSSCPYCHSDKIIKHSKYKNIQRYKCKPCQKTFLPTTGTLVHHIKKPGKFEEYISIVEKEGLLTIKEIADRLQISIPTSFAWRHKLLLSLPKKKDKFLGETQMDDLWFLYSQKGRRGLKYSRKRGGTSHRGDNNFQAKIIVASDKNQVEMKLAKIGRISKNDIICAVGYKFNKNAKLVTDAHSSYSAFAKGANLEHINFKAKNHKAETGENVQYVNNLAGRLKTWVNRTQRGVSTKYLSLYASYFAYTEKNGLSIKELLKNNNVWDTYTNIEGIYAGFIKKKSVRTYRCPTKKNWKAQNWNQSVINTNTFI